LASPSAYNARTVSFHDGSQAVVFAAAAAAAAAPADGATAPFHSWHAPTRSTIVYLIFTVLNLVGPASVLVSTGAHAYCLPALIDLPQPRADSALVVDLATTLGAPRPVAAASVWALEQRSKAARRNPSNPMHGRRIGEASNPGPAPAAADAITMGLEADVRLCAAYAATTAPEASLSAAPSALDAFDTAWPRYIAAAEADAALPAANAGAPAFAEPPASDLRIALAASAATPTAMTAAAPPSTEAPACGAPAADVPTLALTADASHGADSEDDNMPLNARREGIRDVLNLPSAPPPGWAYGGNASNHTVSMAVGADGFLILTSTSDIRAGATILHALSSEPSPLWHHLPKARDGSANLGVRVEGNYSVARVIGGDMQPNTTFCLLVEHDENDVERGCFPTMDNRAVSLFSRDRPPGFGNPPVLTASSKPRKNSGKAAAPSLAAPAALNETAARASLGKNYWRLGDAIAPGCDACAAAGTICNAANAPPDGAVKGTKKCYRCMIDHVACSLVHKTSTTLVALPAASRPAAPTPVRAPAAIAAPPPARKPGIKLLNGVFRCSCVSTHES
jgi:hypothetical protein